MKKPHKNGVEKTVNGQKAVRMREISIKIIPCSFSNYSFPSSHFIETMKRRSETKNERAHKIPFEA